MDRDSYDSRRMLAELEAKVAAAKKNAETVAALEGWGEAADGRVKVCVGPSGALKNVELDPRAMRLPSQDLAASILEAARAGQHAVAEQVRGIYGPDSAAGIDIAAVAQGDLDVSAVIDAKLDQARRAIQASR